MRRGRGERSEARRERKVEGMEARKGWILTAFGEIDASACYVNVVFCITPCFHVMLGPKRRESGVYSK